MISYGETAEECESCEGWCNPLWGELSTESLFQCLDIKSHDTVFLISRFTESNLRGAGLQKLQISKSRHNFQSTNAD